MTRSDRLALIVARLQDGALHRAADLARDLGVSVRTIYRDMAYLGLAQVPLQGQRGAGYRAAAGVQLPPLALSMDELEVLHLALAVVGEGGEPALARAAQSLSAKIEAGLTEDAASAGHRFGAALRPMAEGARGFRHMPAIRAAIAARQKLRIVLQDGTEHVARPLRLSYWGRLWHVLVWSESIGGFARPRIDTIARLSVLPGLFVDEPGKTAEDHDRGAANG